MEYEEIIHRCFRCGYCKLTEDYLALNCPPYRKFRFESYSPGGRLWLIRAWLDGGLATSERLGEILYSCATCGNCMEHCVMKFRDELVNIMVAARTEMVDRGIIPPLVRDTLKSIHVHGNPYKLPEGERGDWAKGLEVPFFQDQDFLFYVGCVGSYDERGQKIARAVTGLFERAGLSFGILGTEETCDGNEVRALGEAGLFQFLVEKNIETFQSKGITRIITLSPHGFNAMKNNYPGLGGTFEVRHYTQVLAELLKDGRLEPPAHPVTVTYHDPCYLGRHNNEYEAPRDVLRSIPGLTLKEMEQNRGNALCCGGGGGNYLTDILGGGSDAPNRIRVRQALATEADVLVVACPQCAKMLEDGLKAEEPDEKLAVMDVAELLIRAMG
jgi:Fe-S oxidoreductase